MNGFTELGNDRFQPPETEHRVYTTLPEEAIIGHEVIQEVNPESDHKPVRTKFRIQRSYLLIV